METAKPFWQSKMVWVNALAIVGSVIVGQYVTAEQWAELTTVILAAANIGLRLITKDAVKWS